MQIAATPSPAAPGANSTLIVRPGETLLPKPVPGEYPGVKFVRLFGDAVFGMMGATHMVTSLAHPNEVRIAFQTYDFAKMADIALRDEVVGVKLLFTDGFDRPFDMSAPAAAWAEFTPNVLRNVGAMAGVQDVRWNGGRSVLLVPKDTETRVNLQRLVEPRIGDVRIWWKGQCVGSGCAPDPAPPELSPAA